MELTAEREAELRALVNSREVSAAVASRARVVLWHAEGRARKDYQFLLARKRRDEPGADRVDPWDAEALTEGTDGAIWIGTTAGISRLLPGSGPAVFQNFTRAHGLIDRQINALATDPGGNIWAGTASSSESSCWRSSATPPSIPPPCCWPSETTWTRR